MQAIRHIRHLLSTELAQTLACSLILSRINYCNAVLHGTPTGTIQKLQRVQNNAARTPDETIPRQAVTAPAALVASPAADHYFRSWQFWHTKFAARPLWFTYTAESQNVPAAELLVHLPFRCWTNRSWEHFSRRALLSSAPSVWNSLQ